MATEKDFELLDDYLSNRMKGEDKSAFERRLEADASLKGELGLQKELIEGIKQARVAELKSMLNEIAVPAPSNGSLLTKAGAAVAVVVAVGIGLYMFVNREETTQPVNTTVTEEETKPETTPQPDVTNESPETVSPSASGEPENEKTIATPQASKATKKPEVSAPVTQPNVEPYDPTKEIEPSSEEPRALNKANETSIESSSIAVETDNTNKKFNFHYQFKEGKLFLLGSFEKDLYEILEFNNNNQRTIFLYYNSNYYLLNEAQTQPTPLKPITDKSLLQKLSEYRGK